MSQYFAKVFMAVALDLRQQYEYPLKSLSGYVATSYWSRQSLPVVQRVVKKLHLTPDSNVLEIGYGRGDGLLECYKKVANGKGLVFGAEKSPFMAHLALKRFAVEMEEEGKIVLDEIPKLINLPYPNNFFDAIYHVDVYYFWSTKITYWVNREILRVLKPGGRLVVGMELNRLKKLEKQKILRPNSYNPVRFLQTLEPAGFENVKMEYEKIGPKREIQIISARRPLPSSDDEDPDVKMRNLEKEIKQHMAVESMLVSQKRNEEVIRQATEKNASDSDGKNAEKDEKEINNDLSKEKDK